MNQNAKKTEIPEEILYFYLGDNLRELILKQTRYGPDRFGTSYLSSNLLKFLFQRSEHAYFQA